MSGRAGLGLGGFLLGLGVGWLIFRAIDVSYNVLAWIIILAGVGVVVSSLLSRGRPGPPVGGMVGGLMAGLILSLFVTSGFSFIGDIAGGGFSGAYRAEGAKSFSGAATSDRMYVEVNNFNGAIRVSTWDRPEYGIDLAIRARTQENLDELKIDFREDMVQGELRLVLGYDIPPLAHSRYAIEVEVHVPEAAVIDLNLGSSNGEIRVSGVSGEDLRLATSNGRLVLDGVRAEEIRGETSNGRIEGELEAGEAVLSTSNGKIEIVLPCTSSGEYDLRTSNGDIAIRVSPSEGVGYDLDLSTSNGGVGIDLPDLEYSVDKRTEKQARTEGFDGRAVSITIKAATSNGGIDIET